MNYLAHILLSGDDMEIATGNFIADGVKGRLTDRFPERITVGLKLHRAIDDFADTDEMNALSRRYMYPVFGKFAGVAQDMIHDHFLAKHWGQFAREDILDHLAGFYTTADEFLHLFPKHQKRFYLAMKDGHWLANYADIDGMDRSFRGLSKRIRLENELHRGAVFIADHYARLEEDFLDFFPRIEAFSAGELERLLTKL